jgi:hypothetical protein
MAWTAPMTFVSGQPLSAAQLNTHLRDNMFETEVAKVTGASQYLVTTARNKIINRGIGTSRVSTTETTTFTDYTDLATIGPQVRSTTGTKALVFTSVNIFNSAANAAGGMSFEIRGTQADGSTGTDLDPRDDWQCMTDGISATSGFSSTSGVLINILVPGLNVFTCKYKVGSGTGSFRYRVMIVFPF